MTTQLRAKMAKMQQEPPDGSTHWSLRKMEAVMGVGKDLIWQVWREADLKPHRLDRYMARDDSRSNRKQLRSSESTATCGGVSVWMRNARNVTAKYLP